MGLHAIQRGGPVTARRYFAPPTVEEALAAVGEHGRASVVAGGTDAVVAHRSGKRLLPDVIVGIRGIKELAGLRALADGSVTAGPLTTYSALLSSAEIAARFTALADASAIVGSPATRNVGTLGGNLVNASPAADTSAPLLVLDAVVEAQSKAGARQLPVGGFWTGPGESVLHDDELLTSVTLPSAPPRSGSAYIRLEYRHAMEIAVVGAAAAVVLDEDGTVCAASVALSAVGPMCFVAAAARHALMGRRPESAAFDEAAKRAADEARPISDSRGTASYRRHMITVMAGRALRVATARAAGQQVAVPAAQHWRSATLPLEVKP